MAVRPFIHSFWQAGRASRYLSLPRLVARQTYLLLERFIPESPAPLSQTSFLCLNLEVFSTYFSSLLLSTVQTDLAWQ